MTAHTDQEDLLRAVEEENALTLEKCAEVESSVLDLRLARARAPRAVVRSPKPREDGLAVMSLVLVIMGLGAVLAVLTQPVAAIQAESVPLLPRELADIQARGMALLQCRIERAELICTEMEDEGDCWVATMTITGDVFPLLLSTNRAADTGAIDKTQTTAYRETELQKLDDALTRCQMGEPVEALQQLVDEAQRRRALR